MIKKQSKYNLLNQSNMLMIKIFNVTCESEIEDDRIKINKTKKKQNIEKRK